MRDRRKDAERLARAAVAHMANWGGPSPEAVAWSTAPDLAEFYPHPVWRRVRLVGARSKPPVPFYESIPLNPVLDGTAPGELRRVLQRYPVARTACIYQFSDWWLYDRAKRWGAASGMNPFDPFIELWRLHVAVRAFDTATIELLDLDSPPWS